MDVVRFCWFFLQTNRTCRLKAEETCSHSHQHSRARLCARKASDPGQPGICMMQSRRILLANLLLTSCRAGMHSRFPQPLATLSLSYLSCASAQQAQCQEELMARIALYGHEEFWPCLGENVSYETCSAPGHQSGLDSRNQREKHRRTKVS